MTIKISASILSADFTRLGQQVAEAEAAGVDLFHLDVMDGHFVPNISFGPAIVEAVHRSTRLPLDVHLMIEEPDRYLADFVRAGAQYVTVHAEACVHLHRSIQEIRRLGAKPGVSLNPATPASSLWEILPDVDLVLVMSVNPGFSGQSFIENALPKIAQIRRWLTERGLPAEIQVDGGINTATAPRVAAAGATILAVGTAIFCHPGGVRQGVAEIRRSLAAAGRIGQKDRSE